MWSRAFVALVVCFFSTPALAQTPVPGGYAPNAASGMKAGIMGPGGSFFVENGWLFYKTNKFLDSRGDEIATQTTHPSMYRVFGIGPEIKWRLKWVSGLQARLRMGFEFGALNNSQGTGGVLSILYAF